MDSYVWLSIIIALSIIEVFTINLTTVWFIISALLSLCLSFFIQSEIILIAVFVLVGTLLLFTTRPILIKYLKVKKISTNLDRTIGLIGVVTEKIFDGSIGEVKVDGKLWSAISKENFSVGDKVKVKEINGVKLIVGKDDVK